MRVESTTRKKPTKNTDTLEAKQLAPEEPVAH